MDIMNNSILCLNCEHMIVSMNEKGDRLENYICYKLYGLVDLSSARIVNKSVCAVVNCKTFEQKGGNE